MTYMHQPAVKRIWKRLLGSHSWTKRAGTWREKERHGLVTRPNYAYGMLRAADCARFFGHRAVTVCEFGVATGNGLLNMVDLAGQVTQETGIEFEIFGFDTGKGLPPPAGFKDHPELWSGGDFSMGDVEALRRKLGSRAQLVLGDIHDTVQPFAQRLRPEAPLGFVSIDVDIYSGTVAALKVLGAASDRYLPAVSFYFDDVGSYFSNVACGELAAMAEYNAAHPQRPIDRDRSLPGRRPDAAVNWYANMHVCHVLDHPRRVSPHDRGPMSLEEHMAFMQAMQ
jgi:hypothetical protein